MNIRAKIYGTARSDARVAEESDKSSAEAVEKPRRSHSRKSDRHRLSNEKVRLTSGDVLHEADLINVSGGGAMISGSFDANLWDSLKLHLGEDGTIECVVRWISEGRMGLEFAHETQLDCSADEQAVLLREVISRTYSGAHFTQPAEPSSTPAGSAAKEEVAEDRSAKRHPLIWSGVLNFYHQSKAVRVRNISATGAMVQCASPVPIGAEAVLELGQDVSIPASVGWSVGDQVGLRFHVQFDMRQLARSTPEVAPSSWVRPSYLDKTEADASPWDPRWQRLSVVELRNELEGFLKR